MALYRADADDKFDAYVRMAKQSARAILRRGPRWARGLAHLLLAGAATLENSGGVRSELETAAVLLKEGDLAPFRIAALYRLSLFVATDEAAVLVEEIENWAIRQRIANKDRILGGLSPGRWHAGV